MRIYHLLRRNITVLSESGQGSMEIVALSILLYDRSYLYPTIRALLDQLDKNSMPPYFRML